MRHVNDEGQVWVNRLPYGAIAPWNELTEQAQMAARIEMVELLKDAPNEEGVALALNAAERMPHLIPSMVMQMRERNYPGDRIRR